MRWMWFVHGVDIINFYHETYRIDLKCTIISYLTPIKDVQINCLSQRHTASKAVNSFARDFKMFEKLFVIPLKKPSVVCDFCLWF